VLARIAIIDFDDRGFDMSKDLQVFERYRPLLFSIAYRMLGSAMEAEDMVQETYLRYRKVPDEAIQSPKAYMSTIITRLCLDQLKSARNQREHYFGTWLPEPILTGKTPGAIAMQHESISMAFMVLLESLSPIERAIFLLREIFDYSYAEIAEIVGKSEANCRQYYHRAKQYIQDRRPRFEPDPDEQEKLVTGFLQALEAGDVEGLTQVLADEVVLYGDGGGKVPSVRYPVGGREKVVRLLLDFYRRAPDDLRIEIAEVNGAAAMLCWSQEQLILVTAFTMAQKRIRAIYNLLNPDKLAYLYRLHVEKS
jgi:RNA polymerase sigma-70 factor (ECF subfamily)